MPLHRTEGWNLKWDLGTKAGSGISSKFTVPVTAASAGLTVGTEAQLAFQQSIQNYWDFDSLECRIIQPTRGYIDDVMESDDLAIYFKRKGLLKSSSLFMITGVIIARGANNVTAIESRDRSMNASLGVELPTIVSSTLRTDINHSQHRESSAQKFTDFVWAVRLAKISRGMFDRQWSHETVASGATFNVDNGMTTDSEIVKVLRDNGLEIPITSQFRTGGDMFVIKSDIYIYILYS
ncbi:hypothetical protein LMH87_001106 [Akanthomyces muscarius]|uniref:Uncharacterized protein n=1 Tax=Akanthomyces muscarius TaxID=2231603 RepID=A0A9W8QI65_AKAMU|nr:hypothetical protein LMH87_001106 [Akanthomyces muscarius]KAJ4155882.1 hypothetical protein LMH87_001106 [Akanthomyces muscarius]